MSAAWPAAVRDSLTGWLAPSSSASPTSPKAATRRSSAAITDAIELGGGGGAARRRSRAAATNRTVVTFVGPPEAVVEAAVRAGRAAAEAIDMRRHHGEHPRFGAMDVCPLVPVTRHHHGGDRGPRSRAWPGAWATRWASPSTATAGPPSAPIAATWRRCGPGSTRAWRPASPTPPGQPDFGPAAFNPRVAGRPPWAPATSWSPTTSTSTPPPPGGPTPSPSTCGSGAGCCAAVTPSPARSSATPTAMPSGSRARCPAVKAIGWFIEEYGIAQVSMNLTDISVTPIHLAFEEVGEKAAARGMRVTGSEIVGLVPLRAMLDAGRYFLTQAARSLGVPDEEIVHIAVRSLGLDDLRPFDPRQKIIEWRLEDRPGPGLVDRTVTGFVHGVARRLPRPGRRVGGRPGRRPGRGPGDDGGQPVGPQAGLGPPLGGVLRLGGAGQGLPRGACSAWSTRTPAAFDALLAAFRLPQAQTPRRRPGRGRRGRHPARHRGAPGGHGGLARSPGRWWRPWPPKA